MKVKFIINPNAGTGKQIGIEEIISKHFNFKYEIIHTKAKGDAIKIINNIINDNDDGTNIIIAIGGDGTVNECLRALIGKDIALGVIPCGSGNGFAYHIGMNKNIKNSIIQLNNCVIKNIDCFHLNNIPFVNVAGIGFDAHIANLFNNNKKRGFLSYIRIILKELSYNANNYKIKYNKNKEKVKAYFIAFANTSQYGNNARISPEAKIDDKLLDVVIVKEFPKWEIPLFIFRMLTGTLHFSNYIRIIRTQKIQINNNENNSIHVDGEPYIITEPITVKLYNKRLKIFTPYVKE